MINLDDKTKKGEKRAIWQLLKMNARNVAIEIQ